jgi:DNA-binding transcriptional MerR regulator
VSSSASAMSASEAAARLGVSIKALRVYERCGLLAPPRTAAGYRVYHPEEMDRAARIVALRSLGLSLSQVARVLDGDPGSADAALAAHEQTLEKEIRRSVSTLEKLRTLRTDRASGRAPQSSALNVAFDLPWPWAGERFELTDIRPLNYIVGPLGSGKTRFAQRLAEAIPGAIFLGLERAEVPDAPTALLSVLRAEGPTAIVVDMIEQGLDRATQETLIADLRERAKVDARPLFLMTRSSSILNLAAVGADEAILFCPANHSPPIRVAPYPGAPGYEAVAMCLASPEVRARSAGVIAWRLQAS